MKKYCKYCKWHKHLHCNTYEFDICKRFIDSSILNKITYCVPCVTELVNKNGKCKEYKRKWYKFWIKRR